jgi:organic hydroperoxide reductase OsmC/OhrA
LQPESQLLQYLRFCEGALVWAILLAIQSLQAKQLSQSVRRLLQRFSAGDVFLRGKVTDNRYSRGHEWSFDGGVKVSASASPAVVSPPFSVTEAIDPEEALVAAASSCHMLAFLFLAARHGFVVESYEDNAFGVMEKNERGKFAISRITLRPRIEFSAQRPPSPPELEALHNEAHHDCYIANSIKCEVVVEEAA